MSLVGDGGHLVPDFVDVNLPVLPHGRPAPGQVVAGLDGVLVLLLEELVEGVDGLYFPYYRSLPRLSGIHDLLVKLGDSLLFLLLNHLYHINSLPVLIARLKVKQVCVFAICIIC